MANSGIFDSYAKHWLFDCVYSLIEKDYIEIARKSHSFKEEDIESRAKENLALLGGISGHEYNISAT